MRIGVPREIKDHEYRVGLTPAGAQVLVAAGHVVQVETRAGTAVGFDDEAYRAAGAQIVPTPKEPYANDLVIKVKELQPSEFALTHAGQILFCYQHLAPDPPLAAAMLERKVTCIAYETVTADDGSLPLLAPMSEIAGRLAIQVGAWALQMTNGGSGVLLAGVPGVAPGKVVIVGGGTVGINAARIATGLGADVTVLDSSPVRLRALDHLYGARVKTRFSEPLALRELTRDADLVVGAVLLPGKLSPKLISRGDVGAMRAGSVIVDVGIDQGGIAETSRMTSLSDPTYVEEGVVHYCVPNMPALVACTATLALTRATLPFVLALAGQGVTHALATNPGLRAGLQVRDGRVTHPGLAADSGHALDAD
jgi:alanine dehydrogenase